MIPEFEFKEPPPEEIKAGALAYYDRVSHTFLDRWPPGLMELSFPTKFIEIDPVRVQGFWDNRPGPYAYELAEDMDRAMDWTNHFFRLNSRSPKDAAYPSAPITCSGRQAVSWMIESMRCLEDVSLITSAEKPLFACLRDLAILYKDAEFRCFAKGGQFIGMSRYFYNEPPGHSEPDGSALMKAAEAFYNRHLRYHFADIVFDMHGPGMPFEKLIEINPYGLSDPCLFETYARIESEGGFMWEANPPQTDREGKPHE